MRGSIVFLLLLLGTSTAFAHLEMTTPAQRTGRREIKIGPCGLRGSVRGSEVTVYRPGETIEIVIDEYVDHPGHYRIAFDDDGQDFEAPICLEYCDDNREPDPVWAEDTTGLVLMDLIPDRSGGGEYRFSVTLPDVECENCTLQVIQVMYDKRPYMPDGNDNYYACADLALRAEGGTDAGPGADAGPDTDAGRPLPDSGTTERDSGSAGTDAGTDEGGGGGCSATGASAGALWMLSLVALRRREES